jgi:hypothetical protein
MWVHENDDEETGAQEEVAFSLLRERTGRSAAGRARLHGRAEFALFAGKKRKKGKKLTKKAGICIFSLTSARNFVIRVCYESVFTEAIDFTTLMKGGER